MIMTSKIAGLCAILLAMLLLSACSNTSPPNASTNKNLNLTSADTSSHADSIVKIDPNPVPMSKAQSEIPSMIADGGWVMNTPGEMHTHRVILAECPDTPLIITHRHDDQTSGKLHKHNGCFVCPTAG